MRFRANPPMLFSRAFCVTCTAEVKPCLAMYKYVGVSFSHPENPDLNMTGPIRLKIDQHPLPNLFAHGVHLLPDLRSFFLALFCDVVLAQIAKMYYGQMGAEGNMQGFVDALQGEKMLPGYASLRQIAGIPNFLRPPLSWVLRNVLGDERKASILG